METTLTQTALSDPTYSVLKDPCPGSDILFISFGGIANALPIPVFEFMRSLDKYRVNKVFVRDFKQCWYTNGLRGITATPMETVEYFRNLIREYSARRVVFLGNSAGGYAAMLFGQLLNVNEVHAFSPQTFVDSWHRLIYLDIRWRREIARLNPDSRRYFDLKKVFRDSSRSTCVHHIYWDKAHRLDNLHARRMHFDNISVHPSTAGGHAVIKHMRNTGELDSLLEKALSQ